MKSSKKTYRIIKRNQDDALGSSRSQEETKHPEEDDVVLVRVKRTAEMRNDIEEL